MNADDLFNGRTGIAAAALLAAVGLGFTSAQTPTMAAPAGGMSEIAKLATKGGLDAVDAMLDARSPGIRTPGALTQTKARRIASLKDAFDPKERVLSGERTRPGDAAPPALAYEQGNVVGPTPYGPVGPAALPDDTGPFTAEEPLPPAAGFYPVPGGGATPILVGGGGGGGTGGGGSGGGSSGGGGTTPGVGGAVPEPATWLSLLIGFFAIGFGLRGGMTTRPARRLVLRA